MHASALILLDLQNEMVDPRGKIGGGGLARICEARGVLRNAERALLAVRGRGWPISHVRLGFQSDYKDLLSTAPRLEKLKEHRGAILGEWGTEFPSNLTPKAEELIVTKQCVNPFFNTGLMTWLLRKQVQRIVIGGVVTNLVVEATARAADDAGFSVTILEDCCAAPNAAWHQFSMENMMPLFGRVMSTSDFIQPASD
jgi:biuret amidohydrolase